MPVKDDSGLLNRVTGFFRPSQQKPHSEKKPRSETPDLRSGADAPAEHVPTLQELMALEELRRQQSRARSYAGRSSRP